MKRFVIVGATGMVGGYALRYALAHPDVSEVTTIGRKATGITHRKLEEVIHPDFANCSRLAGTLTEQDSALFCLGVYTGVVPDAELRQVTVDLPIEFARMLRISSPNASFIFLSGSGADQSGQSRVAFARYKGEAEKALIAARFPQLYLFRPPYIYPPEPRKEPHLGYRLLRTFYPVLRRLVPKLVIRADTLAHAMVDAAVQGSGDDRAVVVLENEEIGAFSASSSLK